MNTMHPLLEDSRVNIARHEFAHAFLAHELGFFVEEITLEDRPDRHTSSAEIVYPLDCGTFGEVYERSPLQAAAWAVIGPRGSWEFSDHAKALAKFESLAPKALMASR